jgi:hypothetical protein
MGSERLCDCGSVADWQEIGSTWMCIACRDRDIQENIAEFKKALAQMERAEGNLHLFKVDTGSMPELLSRLREEIQKIES